MSAKRKEPHYVILGAYDKADKCVIAGRGMFGKHDLTICRLKDHAEYYSVIDKDDIEGIITTLSFAGKNGKESLKALIKAAQMMLDNWEDEDDG